MSAKDYWLISDIHGCFETLIALIDKLPRGANLIFCGDLIDRGPRSKEVVHYAMFNGIPTVMGNHEHLCLYGHGRLDSTLYSDRDIWLMNGGVDALKSYGTGGLPAAVLNWMAALPWSIDGEDGVLLVAHTGHTLQPASGGKLQRKLTRNINGDPPEAVLWYRDQHFPNDGRYRVFGHTQEAEPVIKDTWAMIDTGAAYKSRGLGVLTAFHWPTKTVIQQANIESAREAIPA